MPETNIPSIDRARAERIAAMKLARRRYATTLASPEVLTRAPSADRSRALYAALLACEAIGLTSPRQATLAFVTEMSIQSLHRATFDLEAAGLITTARVPGVGRPREYRLVKPTQADA